MLCQELNYILILAFGKKNYGNKLENLAIAGRSKNGNVTVCGCSKCVNCLGPLVTDPDPYLAVSAASATADSSPTTNSYCISDLCIAILSYCDQSFTENWLNIQPARSELNNEHST